MKKFTITLNGIQVKKEIPEDWSEVTFGQYLDLVEVQHNPSGCLAVFVGIAESTLQKVRIVGLDDVLHTLSFVQTPPTTQIPKEIKVGDKAYKVPKDLAFETTGQFQDAKAIVESFQPNGDNLSREDQLKYLDLVAVFAMPDYLDKSVEEQKEFAQQFLNASCGEVLAVGNFTLLKLIGWKMNIKPGALNKTGALKKLRLAIKIWLKNTAFSLRFAWLKRKLV